MSIEITDEQKDIANMKLAIQDLAKLLGVSYVPEGRLGGDAYILTADGKHHDPEIFPFITEVIRGW